MEDWIECNFCYGQLMLLGALGNNHWFRCIQCGMQQTHDIGDIEECEEENA